MKVKQQTITQHLKQVAGQKFTWFAMLMVSLTITAFTTSHEEDPFSTTENSTATAEAAELTQANNIAPDTRLEDYTLPNVVPVEATFVEETQPQPISISRFFEPKASTGTAKATSAQELVEYAQSLLGTPYIYGGTTTKGFDCSGYIYHIFSKFNYEIERSSRAQSTQGEELAIEEAQPGDLLFFTGTNPKIRTVGHVGIVISEPGEPVSFIHSSSNGGVKISELEGYYTTRFMSIKRM